MTDHGTRAMAQGAYARLAGRIRAGEVIVIDGGTGTELERRGAQMHDEAWCAMATLTAPETLRSVHEDYIRAGACVITANTYASSRAKLGPAGLGDKVEAINRRAVEIAHEARDRSGAGDSIVVAASMSHMVPFEVDAAGNTRRRFPPLDELDRNMREMGAILREAGAELIMLEMMHAPAVVPTAIRAARDTGLPVWVGLSVQRGPRGIATHLGPEVAFDTLLEAAIPAGGDVFGVMHSGVDVTGPALEVLRDAWAGPTMAYPDSGYFEMPHWRFVDVIEPAALADAARGWIDAGTTIIGGCCGLGIEHIEALAETVAR